MYRFSYAGIECSCDTVEELKAVFDVPEKATKVARAAKEATVATNGAAPADTTETASNSVKDLPYVQGGITWKVAKRVAHQVGRTDIRQVRSDLKARQQMGK